MLSVEAKQLTHVENDRYDKIKKKANPIIFYSFHYKLQAQIQKTNLLDQEFIFVYLQKNWYSILSDILQCEQPLLQHPGRDPAGDDSSREEK